MLRLRDPFARAILEQSVSVMKEQLFDTILADYLETLRILREKVGPGYVEPTKEPDPDFVMRMRKVYNIFSSAIPRRAPALHRRSLETIFPRMGNNINPRLPIAHRLVTVVSGTPLGLADLNRDMANLVHAVYGWQNSYEIRPDAVEFLTALARNEAESAYTSFINKNAEKLEAIIAGRVKTYGVRLYGSLEGSMKFVLTDGGSFEVRFSIVHGYSSLGNHFYRYPTTFHNAVRGDGTRIKTPSEKKLKECM